MTVTGSGFQKDVPYRLLKREDSWATLGFADTVSTMSSRQTEAVELPWIILILLRVS